MQKWLFLGGGLVAGFFVGREAFKRQLLSQGFAVQAVGREAGGGTAAGFFGDLLPTSWTRGGDEPVEAELGAN